MLLSWLAFPLALPQTGDYPIQPVSFERVQVEGGFWGARLETNRTVTVAYDFQKCEETGRIANFAKAGGLLEGEHIGNIYDDSDVFKVIEGAAYTLAQHPDAALDTYLDRLIAKIAAAQEDDGYLYTARTLAPEQPKDAAGPERWSKVSLGSHELYNVGHLYEAAVAHFRATGKRSLLDVALKNADLIDQVFGPDGRHDVPGHQEIEIGLVKLYRVTGESRYLKLARFFLDQRGHMEGRPVAMRAEQRSYWQDHLPVTEQREAVGHAVRAAYMYSGMTDIAALQQDANYAQAIDRLWADVTGRKMYLTGGIGARHAGEAFGEAWELPNAEAYNETCAAIAYALWNHRMFLLHGEARYLDVLERVIYNGFLAGVSLQGDRFFYPNPLACNVHGGEGRSAWFGCSCCPVNVVRFLPSIPGMVYAQRGRDLYLNLYLASRVDLPIGGQTLTLVQEGDYPWDGRIRLTVAKIADPPAGAPADAAAPIAIHLRIPGWLRERTTPEGLYRSEALVASGASGWSARLNGDSIPARADADGFLVIERLWQPGDRVELDFDMPIRRSRARDEVSADHGRVAFERGPLVYCVEGVDHGGRVHDLVIPRQAKLRVQNFDSALDPSGVLDVKKVLRGQVQRAVQDPSGEIRMESAAFTAIPYYAWAHREVGEMVVWLPEDLALADPTPPPTLTSTAQVQVSHCWPADSPWAVNDQKLPQSSSDHAIPRHTFWPHRGTAEWVELTFAAATPVDGFEVYWFDDTGSGSCRLPASWQLSFRSAVDAPWRPLLDGELKAVGDQFQRVTFDLVEAQALRLDCRLQQGFSAGILELRALSPSTR